MSLTLGRSNPWSNKVKPAGVKPPARSVAAAGFGKAPQSTAGCAGGSSRTTVTRRVG